MNLIMTWLSIKQSIIDDLNSRGLKDPLIRIRALNNLESIMKVHYPSFISNPAQLLQIDKKEFKNMLALKKGYDLNGAEESIVNEIYRRL